MTAMARELDNLGKDFDQRWKRSSRSIKRELIAELRDIYIFLEEEDMPLLASQNPTEANPASEKKTPKIAQGSLFSEPVVADSSKTSAPRKDNPFLPKSVLDRLHDSQDQTSTSLRELMQSTAPATMLAAAPISHEQVDLERELRLKLGPAIESLIEAQMETLKSELRVRLRAEMDRLIAEHVRKS
jgi:hypothetical protein